MTRTATGALLLAALAMVTLGACTSSGSSASTNAKLGASAPQASVQHSTVGGSPQNAPDSAGPPAARTERTALVDSAVKIRTAWMTVDIRGADNVAAKADLADAIAQSVGGEVDADDRTSGRHATATLQLRVPPNALGSVLNQLARLGAETSRHSSTTDVTERVADVASRVQSARTAIAQLRVLYGRTGKVSDLLQVEDELGAREADLEALEAQQRTLARQTALATITLSLRTAVVHRTTATHPAKRSGFVTGLHRGWDGFVALAVWVASAFATLLPFLVLLALIVLGLRVFGVRIPRPTRSHPS